MNQSKTIVFILEKSTANREDWIFDYHKMKFIPVNIHIYKIRALLDKHEYIIRVTGATYRKFKVGIHAKLKLQHWKLPTGSGYYEETIKRGYFPNGDYTVLNH